MLALGSQVVRDVLNGSKDILLLSFFLRTVLVFFLSQYFLLQHVAAIICALITMTRGSGMANFMFGQELIQWAFFTMSAPYLL